MELKQRLTGLIAATYTPLKQDGSLRLDQVGPMVERLLESGVDGLYVCGSTGEGMSLTVEERKALAREFVRCADRRAPVIIQVGHNSLAEAAALAADAQSAGADVISATCPSYYPIGSLDALVDSMAQIAAAASDLPFYYYHIPVLTHAAFPMVDFLPRAGEQISNLAGLKFTSPTVHEFQQCRQLDGGRFDVLWGLDEMLLSALAVGAEGAIGSTYNIAAPLYQGIRRAYAEGNMNEAQRLQADAVHFIHTIAQYPFHPAMKEILRWQGIDCGPARLPLRTLTSDEATRLRRELEQLHFAELAARPFICNGALSSHQVVEQEIA